MKTLLTSLAIAAAGFTLGAIDASAGDTTSRRSQPHASAVRTAPSSGAHCRRTTVCRPVVSRCHCGVTPAYVYRHGDPVAPVSARVYGYSSFHDANFYRNYPVSRGR